MSKKICLYLKPSIAFFAMTALVPCNAQEGKPEILHYSAEKIVPQSPEVAKAIRYGKYPVNLSSGIVDVSVPIYEIHTRRLDMPISLSYKTSGIKVDEVSGPVGLGWTLNAGGMVAVDVRGYGQDMRSILDYKTVHEIDSMIKINEDMVFLNVYASLKDYSTTVNAQADLFSYNSGDGKLSGSFMFSRDGAIVQIPQTDNRIRRLSNVGFEITASDGTRYIYGEGNEAKTSADDRIFTTGYLLSKVISSDGTDSIVFQYDVARRYSIYTSNFQAKRKIDNFMVNDDGVCSNLRTTSITTYSEMPLTRIQFNGGEVRFSYQQDRADLGANRLARIAVVRNDCSPSEQIMSCDLEQGYFESPDDKNWKADYPHYFKRLKLKKITLSYTNAKDRVFTFEYNGLPLPCYDYAGEIRTSSDFSSSQNASYAQDLWGYYNGHTDNAHMIAYTTECPVADFQRMTGSAVLPNRNVDGLYAQACMLRRIMYPSGGYTSFSFEANDNIGGLRIKSMNSYDRDNKLLESRHYEYDRAEDVTVNSYLVNSSYYRQHYSYIYMGPPQDKGDKPDRLSYDTFLLTSSPFIEGTQSSSPAYYRVVTEFVGKEDKPISKTVYTFNEYDNDIRPNMDRPDYIRYHYKVTDNFWKRGDMVGKDVYEFQKGQYKLVQSTRNYYSFFNERSVPSGLIVTHDWEDIIEGILGVVIDNNYIRNRFDWFDTEITTGSKKLTASVTTEYRDGKALKDSVIYEYDKVVVPQGHQELTREVHVRNGFTHATRYIYPQDIECSSSSNEKFKVRQAFLNAHILSEPFEILDFARNRESEPLALTGGTFFDYAGIGRLEKVFRLCPDGIPSYTGTRSITAEGYDKSTDYVLWARNIYDTRNNIVQTTGHDNIPVTYLWSYSGRYPVAEIRNASLQAVSSALSTIGTTVDKLSASPSFDFVTVSSALRKIPNALVQSFDYAPLLGVDKWESANRILNAFSYDGMGRVLSASRNSAVKSLYSYSEQPLNQFSIAIDGLDNCNQYSYPSFHADITGGSENYSYLWTLSKDGNELQRSSEQVFAFFLTQAGDMEVRCTVTDTESGRSVKASRKVTVATPPRMQLSEIQGADSVYRVSRKNYNFSLFVSGGSGLYSKKWQMIQDGITATSPSELPCSFRFSKAGQAQICCEVKDIYTGEIQSKTLSVQVLPPLDIRLSQIRGNKEVPPGRNLFEASVDEQTGSGDFTYQWTLRKDGATLKQYTSSSSYFDYEFTAIGQYSLDCTVTDNYNSSTDEMSVTVEVMDVMTFYDVSTSKQGNRFSLTGKLWSPVDCTVGIEYGTTRSISPKNNSIQYIIGSGRYSIENYQTGTFTARPTLTKGQNNVEISMDVPEGNNTAIRVWIRLTEVPNNIVLQDSEASATVL